MIKAEIVAHSTNTHGDELISVLCTFPRIILAEVNTHRMLSKNTSSSRAIPFNKMVEAIQTNPFIPIAWQKEHKGMQGSEYLINRAADLRNQQWLIARDNAVRMATALSLPLNNFGGELVSEPATKQLSNRLLEPFMWTTMLITGSREGWDNFFKLRCPSYRVGGKGDIVSSTSVYRSKKDAIKNYPGSADEPNINWMLWNEGQAEIHMMALAESIWDATNESTPKQLEPGEWHIPFEDKFDNHTLLNETNDSNKLTNLKVKVSVAMAARTSYTVVGEEKGLNYENLIGLHNRLLTQDPPHSSPMEHCARAMSDDEHNCFQKGFLNGAGEGLYPYEGTSGWCYNLKGFIPYRYFVDNGLVI